MSVSSQPPAPDENRVAPSWLAGLPAAVVHHPWPGTVLFVMLRREQNRRAFSPAELVICVIALAGAMAGIAALATGAITI